MTTTRVKRAVAGGVCTLTLSRAEKKNAFDLDLTDQLWEGIEQAANDDEVRVVVLTAEGDYFSGGADVNLFLKFHEQDPARIGRLAKLYEPLRACAKPTIAAVQGHAVGMGVTILPHFDLVYASEHVTFMTPFVRIGLVLEYGSAHTLSRLIGRQRAKELILRAAPLSAATAESWGLVTRTFPTASFAEEVMGVAREIAALPPSAVAESKRLIDVGVSASFDEMTAAEDAALANRYGSPENVAAIQAVMSRRAKRS